MIATQDQYVKLTEQVDAAWREFFRSLPRNAPHQDLVVLGEMVRYQYGIDRLIYLQNDARRSL